MMDIQDSIINVNGQVNQTSISVMDYGFLYGFGLFETMRAYDGTIFCLERHLERLYYSAERLQWGLPWGKEELAGQVTQTLRSLSGGNGYVRLSVTRGIGTSLDLASCIKPSFAVMVRPYQPLSAQRYQQGWHLITSTIRRNSTSPFSRVKSLNYADNILAKQEAKDKGADEGLLLNEAGYVAEGCTSNVFVVKNGMLGTPCLESGILNGITRQIVMEIAKKAAVPVVEKRLLPTALADADEVFCTNSLLEIMPVTRWEGKGINQGALGPITGFIQDQYQQMVQRCKNEKCN